MTRDDVIRMAIEAGINEATANFYCAEIGRLLAMEREECAKVAESADAISGLRSALSIRLRGHT